jgi:hypothetical protein
VTISIEEKDKSWLFYVDDMYEWSHILITMVTFSFPNNMHKKQKEYLEMHAFKVCIKQLCYIMRKSIFIFPTICIILLECGITYYFYYIFLGQ